MPPTSPDTLPEFTKEITSQFSYSNIFVDESNAAWTSAFDMETAYFNFGYSIGLPKGLEIGLNIPFFMMGGGFLDSFLTDFHRLFNMPDYGRSFFPYNEFKYILSNNGTNLIDPRSDIWGLSDINFKLKKELFKNLGLFDSSALILGLKLPTGDPKGGFGSGSIDLGYQMVFGKKLGLTSCTLGISRVIPGPYKGNYELKIDPINSAFLNIAIPFFIKGLSAAIQIETSSPLLSETNLDNLKDPPLQILTDFNWKIDEKKLFNINLAEDLKSSTGAPDFSLNISYSNSYP